MTPPRLRLLLSALLAAAVLLVYGRLARYDFISIDDSEYVVENPHVTGGLSGPNLLWALQTPVAGNWHPLTMLSHMVLCQFFGPQPGPQHLLNVLLHLANTLLLFWLLLRLTDRQATPAPSKSASTVWPCFLVAALFALHPLHVESVAWISERKDVLSACFFLLTLLAYARYAARREDGELRMEQEAAKPNGRAKAAPQPPRSASPPIRKSRIANRKCWYLLALLLFALGLMSKPMLVTLPCVLLLLDYWPLNRLPLQSSKFKVQRSMFVFLLLEKLPFFALTALFSIITFAVQHQSGAVVTLENASVSSRLANAVVSYIRYLGKTFWPDALAMPYPFVDWPADAVIGAALLFLALSFLAFGMRRRRPYFFVGWLWFAGMLVPVIGLVQVGFQSMADHFTYLPLIGLFIALAWGLASVPAASKRPRLLGATVTLLLGALIATTSAQVRCWQNSQTLFEHAVRALPHSSAAHYLLGAIYESQGHAEQAFTEFTAAVRDRPDSVRALCGLGYLLSQQGKLDEAVQQYEAALHYQPTMAKAHFGLAEVLRLQGRADQAITHYLAALQARPDLPEAHYQLAALFSARHDAATAIGHLEDAVKFAPDWPLPLNNLAWARATQSQADLRNGSEATQLALRAVSLTQHNNPGTLDTLAAAYAEANQFADAVATAQSAIQQAAAIGQTNLAAEIASRLALYQAQKPYRE